MFDLQIDKKKKKMSSMNKLWKTTTAHSQNSLHVDVLYNIKRKKYKTAIRNPNWSTSGIMVALSYLVPTIYRTRGEHANHYATDAVPYFY
jgi:hypothetical protein